MAGLYIGLLLILLLSLQVSSWRPGFQKSACSWVSSFVGCTEVSLASMSPVSSPVLPPAASAISPTGALLQAPLEEDNEHRKHHMKKGVLAAIILVPTIICGSILLSSYISLDTLRQRLKKSFAADEEDYSAPPTPVPLPPNPNKKQWNDKAKNSGAQVMDYALLQAGTSNFSMENIIGEGGFSRVYRAELGNAETVAVKKLLIEGGEVEMEFRAEIELMSRIDHPNLLKLLGYSAYGEEKLLIYELMRNGSLQEQLQGPLQGAALTWHLRLKVALDSARGLEYLHDQCDPPIIHRDFKSSNILLDADFNAKLSDFGLALSMTGTKAEETLQLQGTFGYVAPEYILTGVLTEKSDVYAFGVVLLELITGKKPIDMSMPTGCQSLVTWATPQLTDRRRLPLIVDAAIKDTVNMKQLFQVAAVAVLCVQSEASYRPLIGDVVNSLIPMVPCEMGGALRSQQQHHHPTPSFV